MGSTKTRAISHFLPASDGEDWLLIATHDEVAEKEREIATQEALREIALAVGGQYNGYEVRDK